MAVPLASPVPSPRSPEHDGGRSPARAHPPSGPGGIAAAGTKTRGRQGCTPLTRSRGLNSFEGPLQPSKREVMYGFCLRILPLLLLLPGPPPALAQGDAGKAAATPELPRLRVFVPELDRTIELRSHFEKLQKSRDAGDLKLVRRIAQGVPPTRAPLLLPYLLHVRDGSDDTVDRSSGRPA